MSFGVWGWGVGLGVGGAWGLVGHPLNPAQQDAHFPIIRPNNRPCRQHTPTQPSRQGLAAE